MYKIIKIEGKDYKLEYGIEASLYGDCAEKIIDFMTKTLGVAAGAKLPKGISRKDAAEYFKGMVGNLVSGLGNMPQTVLTSFYAGLIKHHGVNGDGTVLSEADAVDLLDKFFKEQENVEGGITDFYSMLNLILEQMGEDGFFKRSGLDKMMEQAKAVEAEEQPKNRAQRRAKATGNKS